MARTEPAVARRVQVFTFSIMSHCVIKILLYKKSSSFLGGLKIGVKKSWVPGESSPYNGLYREGPPERGTFFRLQVYERIGKSSFGY